MTDHTINWYRHINNRFGSFHRNHGLVNFNFVAFSRYLGDETGQVFVFFILTVAAAEAAIGLAILVVLFRNRRSIAVKELNTLKG